MASKQGMPVLNTFPAIKQLGEQRLQELCDEFRSGYVARAFAISRLDLRTTGGELSLDFACELTHAVKPNEAYCFPMDELLRFIADNGIADESKREDTKARIRNARERGGPEVYRQFRINPGPKLPLFLTCKTPTCGNMMMTQLTAYRCERQEWDSIDPITCPRCQQTHTYTDADLHFGPNQ
jgi:hypothetical protein